MRVDASGSALLTNGRLKQAAHRGQQLRTTTSSRNGGGKVGSIGQYLPVEHNERWNEAQEAEMSWMVDYESGLPGICMGRARIGCS
jgi:hypothetical protein